MAQSLRDAGNPDAMPPWTETYWLGKQVVKCPMDLWVYQEILWETRPDVLIETGTSGGGSAYFFATLFDRIGNGRIVTVDKDPYSQLWVNHPRIKYFVGDSVSTEVVSALRSEAQGRVMVSLDSLHTYEHVRNELSAYADLVAPGCYLVVEDTGWGAPGEPWASEAVAEFLADHREFDADRSRERHLLTSNRGSWLRRI